MHSATTALNEMFMTLCRTGFSEAQALRLIAFLIEDMQSEPNADD